MKDNDFDYFQSQSMKQYNKKQFPKQEKQAEWNLTRFERGAILIYLGLLIYVSPLSLAVQIMIGAIIGFIFMKTRKKKYVLVESHNQPDDDDFDELLKASTQPALFQSVNVKDENFFRKTIQEEKERREQEQLDNFDKFLKPESEPEPPIENTRFFQDAISALVNLGIPKTIAKGYIKDAMEQSGRDISVEDLVRQALTIRKKN